MKQYKAWHGYRSKAYKIGKRWLIGGDYDTQGALIMLPCKKHDNRMAWYYLNGCFLKFQDFATEQEASATLDQWLNQ